MSTAENIPVADSRTAVASEPAYIPINHWDEEARPREKLLKYGKEALSPAELLAIIIGSGTRNKSAVELMEDVLKDCDHKLLLLNRMSVKELMAYNGIGEAKALAIVAAAEIGRLRAKEEVQSALTQVSDSSQIYDYMLPDVRELTHEECWVFLLNNAARIIKRVRISTGGRTETSVDVRMVLKAALMADATCLIFVHNHPSGNVNPSQDDRQLTKRMQEACRTINLRLLDHVIVTDGAYYSFADNGLI